MPDADPAATVCRMHEARTERLFRTHADEIRRLSLKLLRSPEDAEDATQATYLTALRTFRKGARIEEEARWLKRVARNECLDRLAARRRVAAPEPPPAGDGDPVAGEAIRRAELAALRARLRALPASQREVVVLREWHGLAYDEIARATGTTRSAVESRLVRARRALEALEQAVRRGARRRSRRPPVQARCRRTIPGTP
jgi:RNA polymerase sigma-70 factor (ECF subfamily)